MYHGLLNVIVDLSLNTPLIRPCFLQWGHSVCHPSFFMTSCRLFSHHHRIHYHTVATIHVGKYTSPVDAAGPKIQQKTQNFHLFNSRCSMGLEYQTLHLQNICFGDQCKFTSPMGRIWILNFLNLKKSHSNSFSWICPMEICPYQPFFSPWKIVFFHGPCGASLLPYYHSQARPSVDVFGHGRWLGAAQMAPRKWTKKASPLKSQDHFVKRTWFLYLPSINFQKKYLSFQGLF